MRREEMEAWAVLQFNEVVHEVREMVRVELERAGRRNKRGSHPFGDIKTGK